MNGNYQIRIPNGLFEDKKLARNLIFSALNECFLEYSNTFGVKPNEIEFRGKCGEKMYKCIHDLFDDVYTVKHEEFWSNQLVFRNNKQKTVNKRDVGFDDSNMEMSAPLITADMLDEVSKLSGRPPATTNRELFGMMYGGGLTASHFVTEKDINTEMVFDIYDENIDRSPAQQDNGFISMF